MEVRMEVMRQKLSRRTLLKAFAATPLSLVLGGLKLDRVAVADVEETTAPIAVASGFDEFGNFFGMDSILDPRDWESQHFLFKAYHSTAYKPDEKDTIIAPFYEIVKVPSDYAAKRGIDEAEVVRRLDNYLAQRFVPSYYRALDAGELPKVNRYSELTEWIEEHSSTLKREAVVLDD